MGQLYFLVPRKCQIFGACNEGKAEQVNYLIDEDDHVGKGANCVVSMVHHYLESKAWLTICRSATRRGEMRRAASGLPRV